MSNAKEIAGTILQQLGGNRFIAMTGAKQLVALENGLGCKIGRNSSGANYMRITLNGKDLYKLELISIRNYKLTPKGESDDIYCDMLQSEFTRLTGMYTSL